MKSIPFIALLLSASLSFAQSQPDYQINWPAEYVPGKSKFFVHNEINVAAPPAAVWELLMDAEAWPEWYEGARDVSILNDEPTLSSSSLLHELFPNSAERLWSNAQIGSKVFDGHTLYQRRFLI